MSVVDDPGLDDAAFMTRYRDLFEHSPWVIERALRRRPFADVHRGLMQVVYDASPQDQVALIRAHPSWPARPRSTARSLPHRPQSRLRPGWTGSTKTSSSASTRSIRPIATVSDFHS